MAATFDTIGISAKLDDPVVAETLAALVADLRRRGKQVMLDNTHEPGQLDAIPGSRQELGRTCDLVIVIGGDGSLLNVGRVMAAYEVPILGINLGRLGFMVDVLPEDMQATLDEVFAGHYIADSRLMLSVRLKSDEGEWISDSIPAINECVVRNQSFARILEFETYMDGAFISHHRGDGIVVATPTGSTAYALSGGGPVIHPQLDTLALVPICPHTLSDRPLMVSATHEIDIRVRPSVHGGALYSGDGQVSYHLNAGDRVIVSRSPHDLHLIHPPGYDYFNILRSKLNWGNDRKHDRL